jgi:hypothetical protein
MEAGTDFEDPPVGGFMRPKTDKLDGKQPDVARDAMEDIKDRTGDPQPLNNDVRYMDPNRDRFLGEADRTGRHFDEEATGEAEEETATEASKEHEAD